MNILLYMMACVVAIFAELYPMVFPAKTWKEFEGYMRILQVAVFCLFLCCSWFYGRT